MAPGDDDRLRASRAEHGRECVSILDTCGCDLALDWQAECIHRDIAVSREDPKFLRVDDAEIVGDG